MNVKAWLQVFRAQTAPSTIIIVSVAYLNGNWNPIHLSILIVLLMLSHWWSFGHNSLMDSVMGYDFEDENKRHHPLITGEIKWNIAHKVIHTGMIVLTLLAILFTLAIATEPLLAMVFLLIWVVTGQAYNDGLSKESLLGPVMIAVMTSSMVAWGWLLSHETLDLLGILYMIFIFLVVYFQAAIDGSLKDIEIEESSNLLVKLGVKIYKRKKTIGIVFPDKATALAGAITLLTAFIIVLLFTVSFGNNPWRLIPMTWAVVVMCIINWFRYELTISRAYDRDRDLKFMSLEQILCIYLPIPLLAPILPGILLMIGGIIYFFGMNRYLWGSVSHPKV